MTDADQIRHLRRIVGTLVEVANHYGQYHASDDIRETAERARSDYSRLVRQIEKDEEAPGA